jgi:hypothetical protein
MEDRVLTGLGSLGHGLHGFELTGRGSSWFRSWVPSEIAIKPSDFGFGSPESPLDRRSSALCTSRRVAGFGSRLSLDLSVSLSLSISLNLTPTVSQLSHSVKRRRNEEQRRRSRKKKKEEEQAVVDCCPPRRKRRKRKERKEKEKKMYKGEKEENY